MNANLEQYRIFREVARCASFSRAAKALFVSQPAVSQTIGNLEQSLNTTLFVRGSKGVTLTGDGEMLFHYVDSALNMLEQGEQKLSERAKLLAGEVKIAAADTLSRHYLLPHLQKFNQAHDNIRLKVINRTSSQGIALLKSGAVDFAFANLPLTAEEEKGLVVTECMAIHDVFVAGEKYRELAERKVSFSELLQYPIIMLENISLSRQYVERYLMELGLTPEPEIELGSHDLLLEFAKIGLGISCVMREFSGADLESGALFEVGLLGVIPPRSMGLCRLENMPMSFAATAFYQMILK